MKEEVKETAALGSYSTQFLLPAGLPGVWEHRKGFTNVQQTISPTLPVMRAPEEHVLFFFMFFLPFLLWDRGSFPLCQVITFISPSV